MKKKDYVTFLPEEWCEEEDDNEDEIGDRQQRMRLLYCSRPSRRQIKNFKA